MARKITRTFVSRNVYRTPTGMYYDARTGKRLTGRGGAARERAAKRINARFRDESGKLTFKNVNVKTDGRNKNTGSVYYDREATVPISYDPEISPELAEENAIKHLNEDEENVAHFNVEIGEEA